MPKVKKITVKKEEASLTYYEVICPRCLSVIRGHSKKQCQINYELYHLPGCKSK